MKKLANPRYLAVLALGELEKGEDFIAEILDSFIKKAKLTSVDRGLFTELLYGTVRMKLNLDYVLGQFSKRPLHKIDPAVLNILRVGAYQILYLDRIPVSASVNESVQIAHHMSHQGVAKFVNGVLRNLVRQKDMISYPDKERDPVAYISVKHSYPQWMVKMWVEQWGIESAEAFCIVNNMPPVTSVRVNTLQAEFYQIHDHFAKQGFEVSPGKYAPDVLTVEPGQAVINDPLLEAGAFYVQDEASALIAHVVDPQPDELIYDLCSAPGGKTTHMGQLMHNEGQIVAFDKSATRLRKVRENASRQGITIIQTQAADARQCLDLPVADRVLVDAPCSGLGTLRHRPDIRWRKTKDEVAQLASIQKEILRNAVNYVKPGGRLVYSTCTVTQTENQDIMRWFTDNFSEFVGVPLPRWFPQRAEDADYFRQILPQLHSIDGFFVASFQRNK